MLIYLLFVIFMVMLFITYKKMDEDVISPAFILVAGYTLSILCAIANVDRWNIDLHWNTIGVLTYGTVLFVVVSFLLKKKMQNNIYIPKKIKIIEYRKDKLKWYAVFQMVVFVLWITGIFYLTSQLGNYNDFAERMVAFRMWSSYGTQWMSNYLYFFINQLNQISTISTILFAYIYVTNGIADKRCYRDKMLLTVISLGIIQMLLTGGRAGIVYLLMEMVMLYIFLNKKYKSIKIKLHLTLILKASVFIVISAIIFYFAKVIVGRGSNISLDEIIPYMTMYAGGPIQLLDMFLQEPIAPSNIIGKETFYGIINGLIRFHIIDIEPYIWHLEFRTATTGAFLGNVYTSYRSYLYDFGFLGLTVLPIVFSYVVNWLYYKVQYSDVDEPINLKLIVSMILVPVIFFDFARSLFFSGFVSVGTVKQLIIIVLIARLFVVNYKISLIEKQ